MKIKKTNKQKCPPAILVLSCDKYQDLWKPFFDLFFKYFPDCPYPVFLGSNTKRINDKRVCTVLSGVDHDWSSSLYTILDQIKSKHIFIWLDDIFITSSVRKEAFEYGFTCMDRLHANHIHMHPKPYPDRIVSDGKLGVYEPGHPYRINVLGFWDIDSLKELLLKGENPWNFEIMGSYRSIYEEGFYCLMKPLFSSIHMIEKGKYFPKARAYCQKNFVDLNLTSRETIKNTNEIASFIKAFYFNLMIKTPWRWRVEIMNLLRKLLISY